MKHSKKTLCLFVAFFMALIPFVAGAQSDDIPKPKGDNTSQTKNPFDPGEVAVPPFFPGSGSGTALHPIPHSCGIFFINPTTSASIGAEVQMVDAMTLRFALAQSLDVESVIVVDIKRGRGLRFPYGFNAQVFDVIVGKIKDGDDVGICLITSDRQIYSVGLSLRAGNIVGFSWDGSGCSF